jgi:hypothetical protein
MMPFFFHDAHEKEQADDRVKRKGGIKEPERQQAADDSGEQGRKHRDGMHVALVENAEDDIHDEDGGENKERQCPKKLLEDEAFALHLAFHRRRQHFRGGFLDKIRHVAERRVGLGIEAEGNAGELIQVIDRLQPEPFSFVFVSVRIGIRVLPLSGRRKAGADPRARSDPRRPLRG